MVKKNQRETNRKSASRYHKHAHRHLDSKSHEPHGTSGSNTLVLGEHPENEQKSEKNEICQDVYHCLPRNFRTFRFDS